MRIANRRVRARLPASPRAAAEKNLQI
jgi:hypothetical protein